MTDDDDEVRYRMVLPFDSDDPEFCRGWEAATIYESLRNDPFHRQRFQIHSENAEMALRIAERFGRPVMLLSDADDWLDMEFGEPADQPEEEK